VIESVGIAFVLVVLAAAALVASIRVGMLVGKLMDRALEARVSIGGDEEPGTSRPAAPSVPRNRHSGGQIAREENRHE
jgi:hypothetical protein